MNKKEVLAERVKHTTPMQEVIENISTPKQELLSNKPEELQDKDSKPVCYYLNKHLAREVRVLAAKMDMPISKLVTEALNDLLYKYRDVQ